MKYGSLKGTIIEAFGNIRIYPGGIIWFGYSNFRIGGVDQRSIINTLQPGDVVLRRYSHFLGSLTVPGYWSHCGVCVDDINIIHAAGGGVTCEDILTFTRADGAAILRYDNPEANKKAIDYCNKQYELQTPYDFNFNAKNDALYCSELIWEAYGCPECERKIEKYILPDDLLSISIFKLILDIKR